MLDLETILLPFFLTLIAGLSTALGGLITISFKKFNQKELALFLGFSVGVMIYVAFVELLAASIKDIGLLAANLTFFGGMLCIVLIDTLVPHTYLAEKTPRGKKSIFMTTGMLATLGIAIHNLPEGMIVFISSLANIKLGAALFLAIAIQNIPEGIAISAPVLYGTGNKKKAFLFALGSGLTEPLGALIAFSILLPILSQSILPFVLAFVAGIMVFISFDELLPLCFESYDNNHSAIVGIFLGMVVMGISFSLF